MKNITFAIIRFENTDQIGTFCSPFSFKIGDGVQASGKWGNIILIQANESYLKGTWNSIIGYANLRIKGFNKLVKKIGTKAGLASDFNQNLWSDIFTYIDLGANFNDLMTEIDGK